MQPVSAIAFDAFGTLIQYGARRINPYLRLVGDTSTNEKGGRLPFLTRNVPVEVFAEELGVGHLTHVIRRELEDELASLQLYPEVELTLRRLRATGKRIAVCSNLAYEYGPAVRRLLPSLDAHVLSFEVGAAKPEPAIYEAVCSALGKRPRDVLFVGDSKRCDFDGPQAFGMQARWLDRRGGQSLVDALKGVL